MRWISVEQALPLPDLEDDFWLRSPDVLCQDQDGKTYLAYLHVDDSYCFTPEERGCQWHEAGRDMYNIHNVVRWIPLSDILAILNEDVSH